MNFKKLKSQSGRSMVEMLGVLAIIGVLSVGGIAGYSLSMRRHRANQVVDYVSKYALITYNACQQKMMNGETGTGSNAASGCSSVNITPSDHKDSDLGPLPAGVSDVVHGYVNQHESGDDEVITRVVFTDQKLCQAFISIIGAASGSCNDSNSDYQHITVKTKQN